jgi:CHASE2 domain-containing sensor protein
MFKRKASIVLLAALCACAQKPAVQTLSKELVIVPIDELTLGSLDKRFHVYPIPHSTITALGRRLTQAGARVVVLDLTRPNDPTAIAVDAVQRYTGKTIDTAALTRDASGQMKLDSPEDFFTQLPTERKARVQEHIPTFAPTLTFKQAYVMPLAELRKVVDGKLVYVGATASGQGDFMMTSRATNYPRLFADARLADQLLTSAAGRPGN